jgi:amino acid adenylation domain-containing protein
MARYEAGGNIEFMGRADEQVKVRGFRVELGEIEAALSCHPAVREVLLLFREDTPGDKRLVAYVVPDETAQVTGKELRNFLRNKLPEYMLPSAFVMLERMPLGSTGKVDRRALPAPERARHAAEESCIDPRNPVEEILAGIWSDVLGLDRAGVYDNFFDLGGHSLLAMQVIARIHFALQVEIPVRRLFECPTVAELAETIQPEIKASRRAEVPLLRQARHESSAPVSFAQRRLWFLDQLEAEKSVYNIAAARRLIGQLNAEALERALGEIVRRHEALRTTFTTSEGKPLQLIHPFQPVGLPLIDLTHHPESGREAQAQTIARDEARRPFDLRTGPLMRAILIRVDEDDHVLVITLHHIVSDGWSMGVLTEELATLYTTFCKGEPLPLAELPIQYADFAAWQLETLQGEVLEAQLEYWRRQLGGELAPLELPADRQRPAAQGFRGATLDFTLPLELLARLKALSRQEGVTLYMTLLAAFQALLSRYTGQQDICVGSPIANRNHPALERLIGFFANTLVMRTDLTGQPTFKELLARVREVSLEAYAHQDLPFEILVEELQPVRNLSHSPLFQVLFVLQNAPQDEFAVPGLTSRHMDVHTRMAHFDLTLSMMEEAGELIGTLEYRTDLFDESTIRRMADSLEEFLKAAVADRDQRVSRLSILTETERQKLLIEFNAGQPGYSNQANVHEMFEQQAERTPDEIAAEFEGGRLTYRELNRRANQLAHYLGKAGAGPDVLIGLCLARGLESVVGLLGILKAGAAYVPLDPAYPTQRLARMLEGVRLVLTERRLTGALPVCESGVVCLDEIASHLAEESSENPASWAAADNLAYVVYTSGSTGTPKGVAMSQGSIANMIRWQLQSSRASVGTRTLQFASLSFDVSFQEIISTLCSGATLVLIPEELRQDDGALLRFLAETKIERLFVPFVMLQQLAERSETEQVTPGSLREVMTAGEQLKITSQIESFFSKLPECTLYNHYGPSETHAASWLTLEGAPARWSRLPSVGRRLPHAQIYILDGEHQPVPLGVIGELYIGGEGLGRGYLNEAGLTAERFLPDPFSRRAGPRMYRSGDMARYEAGGNIEFMGRADEQVKVRGFRVELGEIETVLGQHPAVREAVVIASEHKPGQKRLAAYVIPYNGRKVTNSELRSFLKERLPDYMLPSAFLALDELPLTRSGKVDRRALPAPESSDVESDYGYAAPLNHVEEILAEIWADLLGVERVGVDDNFFDLGGHSLMAARLVSRVRDALGVELPLRRLFEEATVVDLAKSIQSDLAAGGAFIAPPLVKVPKEGRLALSFAQERMWFLDQLNPSSAAYSIPAALRATGRLDVCALEQSFNSIIKRHESLRTTFTVVEGRPAQVIHSDRPISLAVTDLEQLEEGRRETEATRIAAEEAQQPFDLEMGPLARVRLLRLHEQEHVLLVTMHHIISDGWSVGVLVRELAALYEAYSRGEAAALEELPVQYSDYAQWQRQHLSGELLAEQMSYWEQKLGGEGAVLELPTDRPRSAMQSYRGAHHKLELGSDLSRELKRLRRSEGVTMFMLLMAAYKVLLYRYSGQQHISVGTPVANRNRMEVEGLIGLFVNTLVMRTDLGGEPTFVQVLEREREVALGAYTHQELPFERLVEQLHPQRSLSHSPLFQAMFIYQESLRHALKLPGIVATPLDIETYTAKFDLSLSLEEEEGGLVGQFEYNTDLFDGETISRMARHFKTLLAGIVSGPRAPISTIPLLTESETQHLIFGWNETSREFPSNESVLELIEEQARSNAEAGAIICGGQRMSYRRLNARANQLGRYLKREGARPEQRVGICMRRGAEMVIGLLGIMKSGAAYVPLDATYPQQRLVYMVQDAGAELVVVDDEGEQKLSGSGAKIVNVTRQAGRIEQESEQDVGSGISRSNLAYVTYTSGSTGTPKGVAIEHGGLMNLINWHLQTYRVSQGDRATQVASPAFDAIAWELWPYLAAGASIHIPEEGTRASAREMLEYLALHGITICFLPTPLAESVLQEQMPADLMLKALLTGGDKLRSAPLDRLPFRFVNHYGPTEYSVVTTFAEVEPGSREVEPPIGRPIANTKVYILDQRLRPVPQGVIAEMFISGAGLARGYFNRPDSTSERFLPDPFSKQPGARMYRTGDLARRLAGGQIEFTGRADQQVKLRGYRIELAEIEAALSKHEAVREALVIAREDAPGDKRLVAYTVATPGRTVTPGELRGHLKERLPDYMLPSAFVALDEMPLTENGKVDRQRLPKPDGVRPDAEERFVAPATRLERVIAAAWRDVLKVDKVGRHDNFFDLGGHSLLMTQVHTRLRQVLNKELSMIELFKFPSVISLARHLAEDTGGDSSKRNQERGRSRRESIIERGRLKQLNRAKETGR